MATMRSEDTVMMHKCLEFCQTLISQGQTIYFAVTIGSNFSFSLDARKESPNMETKKKSSTLETKKKTYSQEGMARKKKLSPSQIRRNLKRKEAFLLKKSEQSEREKSELKVQLFKCTQCENIYKSETDFKDHMESSHLNEDHMINFKCDECENMFTSEKDYKSHTESEHMKEDHIETIEQLDGNSEMKSPSFNCTFCGDTFESKDKQHNHTIFCEKNIEGQEFLRRGEMLRQQALRGGSHPWMC